MLDSDRVVGVMKIADFSALFPLAVDQRTD